MTEDQSNLREKLPVTLRPLHTSVTNLIESFGQANYVVGLVFNSLMIAAGVGVWWYFAGTGGILYSAISILGVVWALIHVVAIIKWGANL